MKIIETNITSNLSTNIKTFSVKYLAEESDFEKLTIIGLTTKDSLEFNVVSKCPFFSYNKSIYPEDIMPATITEEELFMDFQIQFSFTKQSLEKLLNEQTRDGGQIKKK